MTRISFAVFIKNISALDCSDFDTPLLSEDLILKLIKIALQSLLFEKHPKLTKVLPETI